MKQTSVDHIGNTWYRVILACLYWRNQAKVREFHVVLKVVTLTVVAWEIILWCRSVQFFWSYKS